MELTPGRQRLVFVVIVLALAGARHLPDRRARARRHASRRPVHVGKHGRAVRERDDSGIPPSSLPTPTPVSTAGGAEIYQWLPFTPAELTAAAQTTVSFAKDYVTWSYTENDDRLRRQDEQPG